MGVVRAAEDSVEVLERSGDPLREQGAAKRESLAQEVLSHEPNTPPVRPAPS
jgi:hypothetical protein